MKFMMFIKHPGDYGTETPPESLFAAMGAFVEDNAKKGIFLGGAGLKPLKDATRVKLSRGRIKVTDGPFSEAKEVVGGYALCELPSREAAVELATKFMDLHREHWPEFEGECELRPLEDEAQS